MSSSKSFGGDGIGRGVGAVGACTRADAGIKGPTGAVFDRDERPFVLLLVALTAGRVVVADGALAAVAV